MSPHDFCSKLKRYWTFLTLIFNIVFWKIFFLLAYINMKRKTQLWTVCAMDLSCIYPSIYMSLHDDGPFWKTVFIAKSSLELWKMIKWARKLAFYNVVMKCNNLNAINMKFNTFSLKNKKNALVMWGHWISKKSPRK